MGSETAFYHPIIRELPSDERPRERLRLRGPGALTNPELLAILLRTGSKGENVVSLATRLLAHFDGVDTLGRASFAELCAQKHVGPAKASQILAALELGTRIMSSRPDRRHIRCPEDVYALLGAEMALLDQEHLRVVLLNTRNQVISTREVYKGNVHSAIVRVAEVFKDAVREGCPSLIVVHNHPSGDPEPSPDDASLTGQLEEAGRLLGIEVADHIVIGRNGIVSLRGRGLGFARK
ncbi:MAG TPA: DNA repair protein RadC [Dehalococcoidia bacterium]|jgi:DNA repair protein RadC|nr:DNA repair protein RadC [Dehalococcoidia bacterium]